ncbi:anthranilate phosphoribosyltransferase [Corynebacterium sp. 13CS0277]|uniref:anthranilate phosphoribosyltransferase n=1 Tax=Corynebacterium sp. 13CS0277 TaxID=2071994 RepID=UPI000D04107E|nr:anthranilate phosphoribosyltransferase [Corynebacterium sp. 13CS0277]PRQ11077.1 anthranilate phosphoribosyltransferase [Corynebacterium sp. 13CS0277]
MTTPPTTPAADLRALLNGACLEPTALQDLFRAVAAGEFTPVEIAALLIALKTRGETPEDIAAAATAFTAAATPFPRTGAGIIDCVGTGGDGAGTINISTGSALIAAAGGLEVVKHGNRSVSSKSGAADVLEALGVPLDLSPEQAAATLESQGFTFLFAPAYHPAFKHVMPVRQALGVPTIFNLLGPLLNPARPALQLMGTARAELGPHLIEVMRQIGRERALVVHGSGLDEIAVHGPTEVWELRDGEITHYTVTPEDLGLGTHTLSSLVGGDGRDNAQFMMDVFAGRGSEAHKDAMLASCGALFYLAGHADTLAGGVARAREVIDSGQAARWAATHLTRAGEFDV